MRTLSLRINNNFVSNSLIQIFVSPSQVRMRKITNNRIVYTSNYDENNIDELFNYLLTTLKTPTDVVFLGDMEFRNITSCDVNNLELRNTLRKSDCNTAFFVRKEGSIEVCDITLSNFAISIAKRLSEIGVQVNSFSCWPFWIINSYFTIFPRDAKKFKCSTFVITTNEYVDIAAVIKGTSILCNRHFEKRYFSEKEVENTVQYISEQTDLKLDDIAVYCISEETVATLIKKMSSTMSFVSRVLPENIVPMLNEHRKIIKTVLRIVSSCFVVYLAFQISELISLHCKILDCEEIKNSVPEIIVSEMELWKNVKIDMNQIDYTSLITNILANTENANILNVDITTKNSHLFINIKMLDRSIDHEYTKNFVFDDYKLEASVSEKGIMCSGTPS